MKLLQKRVVKRKNEKFGIEVPKPMDVRQALEKIGRPGQITGQKL